MTRHKHLGLIFSSNAKWAVNIENIIQTTGKKNISYVKAQMYFHKGQTDPNIKNVCTKLTSSARHHFDSAGYNHGLLNVCLRFMEI